MTSARRLPRKRGFTLIELLVVIGIILLLMAILLPVVGQVQIRGQTASTQSQMMRIMAACQEYYHDFNAYPGPIANVYLSGGASAGGDKAANPAGFDVSTVTGTASDGSAANGNPSGTPGITSSENLVLGLFGFLSPPSATQTRVTWTDTTYVSPFPHVNPPSHDVLSLNQLHPASYHYMDFVADELSAGPASGLEYTASQGTNTDTMVPEFVDRYAKHLPILYVRANPGNPTTVGTTDVGNQYNYSELQDYMSFIRYSDGTAPQASPFTAQNFTYLCTAYNNASAATPTPPALADNEAIPFLHSGTPPAAVVATFTDYFANTNIAGSIRGKDGFVLISAGPDHTYGTTDDIIITP